MNKTPTGLDDTEVDDTSHAFCGFVGDVRIIKGAARYTSNNSHHWWEDGVIVRNVIFSITVILIILGLTILQKR
jgi:hypothetical protein